MNERMRRLYEMFLRVLSFMLTNQADFADIVFVAPTTIILKNAVKRLGELGAEKMSVTALAKDATVSKGDARQNLRDALEDIRDIWRSVFDEVGGAQNKYRIPNGTNDQSLIAAGKAFAADAETDKAIFIEYGLPQAFITDLKAKITEFETAVQMSETARGERVGTNAAFEEQIKICRKAVEKLDPAIRRKYRNNPRKLAEWTVASHVERAPQSAPPTNPPTM